MAQAVAKQVRVQVGSEQQARRRSAPAVNPKAYEAYLKGRFAEIAGTQAAIKQAQSYFEESIREDPSFALAYAGLADCYVDLGDYRWLPPKDAYPQANAAVQKALELDEGLGEAHSTVGMLNWHYGWDWQAAERELRHAVDLNANYVEGHESLVWYLAWSGRPGEAQAEIEKMRALDPAIPPYRSMSWASSITSVITSRSSKQVKNPWPRIQGHGRLITFLPSATKVQVAPHKPFPNISRPSSCHRVTQTRRRGSLTSMPP